MTNGVSLPRDQVKDVRGERLLRMLHRVLPLGRHYQRVFSCLNHAEGLVRMPFAGAQLVVPAAWEKVAVRLLLTGRVVIPDFALIEPYVPRFKDGCLVDVGANIGLYTLSFRQASPLNIIAFEPQPFMARLVRWNVELNGFKNIEVRNVACGSQKGEALIWLGCNGSILPCAKEAKTIELAADWQGQAVQTGSSHRPVSVPVVTLDENLAGGQRVALLKIDCEGYEHHILLGARQILERDRPQLFIEIHLDQLGQYGHSIDDLLGLLTPAYDLEFWVFQHNRLKTKLGRSLAKFKTFKPRRCSAADVRKFAASNWIPNQLYCIGHPKNPR